MKKLFFVIAFACSASVAYAQSTKTVFAEFGGPGLVSVNFDSRFSSKDDGLGFRAGIGGWSVDNSTVITVPVGMNYLLGKDGKHYFEMGAGFTYVNSHDVDGTFSSSFGHITFGYRLSPKEGGFSFRGGFSPVFGNGFFIPWLPYVSLGYTF